MSTFRIGIDVGGTFTDIVCVAANGMTTLAKEASTPLDQSEGVVNGLAVLARRLGLGLPELLARTDRIVHGTTVATNALLERKGAKVAMLTTEGHRDVIEMREGLKPERYNLRLPPAPALVPRRLRLPVCRAHPCRWNGGGPARPHLTERGHCGAEGGEGRGGGDLLPAFVA